MSQVEQHMALCAQGDHNQNTIGCHKPSFRQFLGRPYIYGVLARQLNITPVR